jgi:hypothetical protein
MRMGKWAKEERTKSNPRKKKKRRYIDIVHMRKKEHFFFVERMYKRKGTGGKECNKVIQ